jgi:hypothetical protein
VSIGFDDEVRMGRVQLTVEDEEATPEVIDAGDLKVLGELRIRPTMAGTTFVKVDGREFELGRKVYGAEHENAKHSPDAVILQMIVSDPPFGRHYELRHAREVPVGTYERRTAEIAQAAAAKAKAEARAKQPHPVDVADLFDVLDRTPAPMQTSPGPVNAVRALLSRQSSAADVLAVQRAVIGKKQIRGIEAIRAFIEGQGVRLTVVNGRLLATGTAMSLSLHAVIGAFEPLLVGLVTGKPVLCALKHDRPVDAYTLAVPSLPICQAHLEETPR